MIKTPPFPNGRPKRYWITEKQRVTQARKSFKTLCDIRDDRVKDQEWDEVAKEYVSVAASVKEVREAAKTIMAYAIGMPTQAVEHTGEDGEPITVKTLDGFDVGLYAKLLGAVTVGAANGAGVPETNGNGKQVHTPLPDRETGGVP